MFGASSTMRLGISALFVVFFPMLLFAGGGEEGLECFDRDDLEDVRYEELAVGVNELFESGIDEVVLCMSAVERRGTRTVVEIQMISADSEQEVESAEEGILSLGNFIRVHQEVSSVLGGNQLSPYFPIQMLRLPTEQFDFSSVERISSYVSMAILNVNQEDVTYRIGTLRDSNNLIR